MSPMPRVASVTDSDLLPKDLDEFRSKSYWDSFFQNRKSIPFEWYGDWKQLQKLFAKECHFTDEILVVGCGNSELSPDMYDSGYLRITNVDFSRIVIAEMLKKHVRSRPQMRWLLMDITKMTMKDGTFDIVVDKGGLDALMGEPGPESLDAGNRLLSEVTRVLRAENGRYLCITLAQEHVLGLLLERLRYGWTIAIHLIPRPPGDRHSGLQPFLVVATKSAKPMDALPLVTLSFGRIPGEGMYPEQMAVLWALVDAENEMRTDGFSAVGPELSDVTAGELGLLKPGRCIAHHLSPQGADKSPRYTATVLDAKAEAGSCMHQCAVFLVPQGREHEWLFAAEEGQWQLVETATTERLILVKLNRGHTFGTSADVQAELSPLVLQLAPLTCRDGKIPIPFMTTGDGIGKRSLLEEVESPLSGGLLVEDVELASDGAPNHRTNLRRLVFKRSLNLVQSEVALKVEETGGGGKEWKVDHSYLASEYHVAIIAGLALLEPLLTGALGGDKTLAAMVVGLGGGALPMFLRHHFPMLRTTVVELDTVVAEVAKKHFEFLPDSNLQIKVGDGLEAVEVLAKNASFWHQSDTKVSNSQETSSKNRGGDISGFEGVEGSVAKLTICENTTDEAGKQSVTQQTEDPRLHLLVVDADSDDPQRIGMSCPPEPFLAIPFLKAARTALHPSGLLAVNVVSRSAAPYEAAIAALVQVFEEVYELDVDEDVNRVLFALPSPSELILPGKYFHAARERLVSLSSRSAPWDQVSLVASHMDSLRLVGQHGTVKSTEQ